MHYRKSWDYKPHGNSASGHHRRAELRQAAEPDVRIIDRRGLVALEPGAASRSTTDWLKRLVRVGAEHHEIPTPHHFDTASEALERYRPRDVRAIASVRACKPTAAGYSLIKNALRDATDITDEERRSLNAIKHARPQEQTPDR
jgi:hypothetical protein